MKNDLVTSIGVALFGVIASYFICNIFIGPIEDVEVKNVNSTISTDVATPNPEVFNYKAINPTVEVYVGESNDCEQYDDNGECINGSAPIDSGSSQPDNQGNP